LPYFPKLAGIDAAYAEKTLAEFRGVSPSPNELFFEILKLSGANKDAGNVSRGPRDLSDDANHVQNKGYIPNLS
jgi:hypothetical protein